MSGFTISCLYTYMSLRAGHPIYPIIACDRLAKLHSSPRLGFAVVPTCAPADTTDRAHVKWADPQRLDISIRLLSHLPAVPPHARRAGEAPEDRYSTGVNPPNFNLI